MLLFSAGKYLGIWVFLLDSDHQMISIDRFNAKLHGSKLGLRKLSNSLRQEPHVKQSLVAEEAASNPVQ